MDEIQPAIRKMLDKDIERFFNYVRNSTKNFSIIKSNTLINASRCILIFRLILDEKRIGFAKRFNVTDSTIANLESGRRVIKTFKTSKKYCDVIREITKNENFIRNANLEVALNNFHNFKDSASKGYLINTYENRKIAAKAGLISVSKQKLDNLEEGILKYLIENGINEYKNNSEDFPFTLETHQSIEAKNKNYNVDFVLPNKLNPFIIIEATNIKSKNYQTNAMKGSRINSRFANIKLKYPDALCFAIVKSEIGDVPEIFKEEIMYGKVINIDNINEFLKEVKNKLALVVQ